MSSSIKQRPNPGVYTEAILLGVFIGTVVIVVGTITAAAHLAAWSTGAASPPANPFQLVIELVSGRSPWTPAMTRWMLVLGILAAAIATTVLMLWWRVWRRRARVDRAARRMGRGRDAAALSRKGVQAVADRFGITDAPGLMLGRTTPGGAPIYQDWESVSVMIAGPRSGKSTAVAIPVIMQAPGAAVVTSNKRDLCDATRDPRREFGHVWVFDPQQLVDEPITWWWNPLSYVTDETRAQTMAQCFATSTRKAGSRLDAYFDNAATDLLANLLLAAAYGGRSITDVYLWLTDPNDDTPAHILAEHGFDLPAASVKGVVGSPDKQRAGVYGTAQQVASFLTNRDATAWVTPRAGLRFDPKQFVQTHDTLYLLSQEGRGNAGPLVTALTVAVCEAAEEYAKTLPGGRMATPFLVVGDEAANCVRWADLPDKLSHYGSRGVNVLTFLQSWSQGVEVWGREGMRKIWSACNTKLYAGGVSEAEFLDEMSRLIGDYTHVEASVSYGDRRGRTVQASNRATRILDVADLAALDRGRMVVFASGAVPVLATTVPWWETEHAPAIRASIAAHDPGSLR